MKSLFFATSILGLSTATRLTKRCSPLYDPDYYHGYVLEDVKG